MTVQPISSNRQKELREHTVIDPSLQALCHTIKQGWPTRVSSAPAAARPFFAFRNELTVDNDIIMKGTKAVILQTLRSEYLTIIHKGHPGAEAMKHRACAFWPPMEKDVDEMVKACSVCNSLKNHQRKEPLQPNPVPPTLVHCCHRHI